MKKFLVIALLIVCGCASEQLKPEFLESTLAVGLTAGDVIATLGLPDDKRTGEEKGSLEFLYPGYVLSFIDGTLATAKTNSQEDPEDLALKPVDEKYKPDALALSRDSKIPSYQIAGFLHDEDMFLKALNDKINPNGFTLRSNALCVALTEGFLKGTEALLKAGYNPDIQLRSDKGIYIFPPDCLRFQKDPETAAKLKALLDADAKAQASGATSASGTGTVNEKKENSKPVIDWQEVKDFLKPNIPPTKSNIDRK